MHVIMWFRNTLRFFSLLFFPVAPLLQFKIMGSKKPEDPETPIQSYPHDSSSNVFESLFGETATFANLFKRKHNELGVESEKIEKKKKTRKVEDVEDEMEEDEREEETRTPQKREKRKYPDAMSYNANDTNSEVNSVKNDAKKVKGWNFDVLSDINFVMETEREGNANSGDVSNGRMNGDGEEQKSERNVDMDKKDKKKKRKREELEMMYDVKKYGSAKEEDRGDKRGDGNNDKGIGKKRKKGENPAEMMEDSTEGFDDESELLRTVFVGNLPLKFKTKALIKEFSKFGEVESVRIRSVPLIDVRGEVVAFSFFIF